MLIRANTDGTYSANWTPGAVGLYTIHVTIDDIEIGLLLCINFRTHHVLMFAVWLSHTANSSCTVTDTHCTHSEWSVLDAGLEVEVKDPPKGMIPPGTQMVKPKADPQPSKVSLLFINQQEHQYPWKHISTSLFFLSVCKLPLPDFRLKSTPYFEHHNSEKGTLFSVNRLSLCDFFIQNLSYFASSSNNLSSVQ